MNMALPDWLTSPDEKCSPSNGLISFTEYQSPRTLTKTITVDGGRLVKHRASSFITRAVRRSVASLAEVMAVLDTFGPHQAAGWGVHQQQSDTVEIVKAETFDGGMAPAGAIARSLKCFNWSNGPGVFQCDIDCDHDPEQARMELIQAGRTVGIDLSNVEMFYRPSASAGVYCPTDELKGGGRIYFAVADAADIPRLGNALFDGLWINGKGRIDASAAGTPLERSLIDAAVWSPERVDYTAAAVLGEGVSRRPMDGARRQWGVPGVMVDLRGRGACPAGDGEQQMILRKRAAQKLEAGMTAAARQAQDIRAAAVAAARPMLAQVRAEWAQRRGDEKAAAMMAVGAAAEDANRLGAEYADTMSYASESRRLRYDFVLYLDKELKTAVRVADILAHPAKYHGLICADPLEPLDSHGKSTFGKARIFTNGVPLVSSFMHGGCRYHMSHGARYEVNIHAEANASKEVENLSAAIEAAMPEQVLVNAGGVVCLDDRGDVHRLGPDLGLMLSRNICFTETIFDKKGMPFESPCGLKSYQATNYIQAAKTPGLYGMVQKQVDVFANRPVFDPKTNRVIADPGYHPGLRMYLNLDGSFPAVPEITTKADALRVMTRLIEPFGGFTVFNPDGVINLAPALFATMILSAALRNTVLCPAFLVSAAWAGTGKTELTRTVIAGLGARMSAVKWSTDDVECTKIFCAWARDSRREYLVIENHDTALYGSALEAMLDKPMDEVVKVRLLGTNDVLPIHNTPLVIANGNNLRPGNAAIARRCIMVQLEASDPPAWSGRQFAFGSPGEYVLNNWRERHMSLLGLVQWFVTYGNGDAGSGGLNAYPDFDRLIRQLVLSLYGVDVARLMEGEVEDTREANDASDPKGLLFTCAWKLSQAWLAYDKVNSDVLGDGSNLFWSGAMRDSDVVGTAHFTMSQLRNFIRMNNLDPTGKLREVMKRTKGLPAAGVVNGLRWFSSGRLGGRDGKSVLWHVVGAPTNDE